MWCVKRKEISAIWPAILVRAGRHHVRVVEQVDFHFGHRREKREILIAIAMMRNQRGPLTLDLPLGLWKPHLTETPLLLSSWRRAYIAEDTTKMSPNGRLTKELAEVGKDDKTSGVKATPVKAGDLNHLKGTINGPLGTCYEGGVFEVDIIIPKQYPFEPPKMKFTTKVWHPNVSSQTGAICLVSKLKWQKA